MGAFPDVRVSDVNGRYGVASTTPQRSSNSTVDQETITAADDDQETITAAMADQERSRRLPTCRPQTLLATPLTSSLVRSLRGFKFDRLIVYQSVRRFHSPSCVESGLRGLAFRLGSPGETRPLRWGSAALPRQEPPRRFPAIDSPFALAELQEASNLKDRWTLIPLLR
jgi:hypothetical protein